MAEALKPKWDEGQDYRAGLKALEIAQEFKERLEPRLPAGLLDGLKEDVAILASFGGQEKTKVTEIKGFTGSQDQAVAEGGKWASLVREALKRGKARPETRKAAGVGSKFQATVGSARASVSTILLAYEKYPGEFRAAGVLPEDMDEGKGLLSALGAADESQETAMVKRTATTAGRNALRMRVEDAVDRIRGAGVMAFGRKDPKAAARFEALVPSKGGGGEDEEEPPKA